MSIQARKNENVGDWRMTQKILKNKFVSENTTTVIAIFLKIEWHLQNPVQSLELDVILIKAYKTEKLF